MAEETTKRERARLQLDFTSDELERIDVLAKLIGARTRTEFIRRIVRAGDALIMATEGGGELDVRVIKGESVVHLALLLKGPF